MRQVDWNDVKFARYLADNGALDNWTSHGNENRWRNSSGDVVAIVQYVGGLETKTFVRD